MSSKPRVVILGAGFGGLAVAKILRASRMDVFVVDRNNHHVFQPLLYQVATAALSAGDIAQPIRSMCRGFRNTTVIMDEVKNIDPKRKLVTLSGGELPFDYLIAALGNRHAYFSHPEWEHWAPGLKTLNDALEIRERILLSFENAERFHRTPKARPFLTFVIAGGGPTGVELAGAIAEIGRKTMLPDFPLLRAEDIRVYLVEPGPRILSSYPPSLSLKAQQALEKLGVALLLNTSVKEVKAEGVLAGEDFIETANVIWAAGNRASPVLESLGVPLDRAGRVIVNPDSSIPGHEDIFVIGDAAAFQVEGGWLPGVAQVAIQQGRYVAHNIKARIPAHLRKPFTYRDKGSMATIGRAKAIAVVGKFKMWGLPAWLIWGFVHIYFLIGFRSRWRVMSEWIWYYITFQPGARLILRNHRGSRF